MLKNELKILEANLIEKFKQRSLSDEKSQEDFSKFILGSCGMTRETWAVAALSYISNESLQQYFDLHFSFLSGLLHEKFRSNCVDGSDALYELMDHLLKFYNRYISQDQWVEPDYLQYRIRSLKPVYGQFCQHLLLSNADEDLKLCLRESLDPVYLSPCVGPITLGALFYREELIMELSSRGSSPALMTNESLISILMALNFNHAGFFSYLRKRFLCSISNLRRRNQAEYIAELIAIVPAYEEGSRLCFDSKWPHISVMYREWLNDYRALLSFSSPFVGFGPTFLKLPLSISVKQLACLIRVLYELGFYGQVSLTAIFDHAAAVFTTKRQHHISAESISNAYYALEQSSSLKVFRMLSKAVDFLKPYCFPA